MYERFRKWVAKHTKVIDSVFGLAVLAVGLHLMGERPASDREYNIHIAIMVSLLVVVAISKWVIAKTDN